VRAGGKGAIEGKGILESAEKGYSSLYLLKMRVIKRKGEGKGGQKIEKTNTYNYRKKGGSLLFGIQTLIHSRSDEKRHQKRKIIPNYHQKKAGSTERGRICFLLARKGGGGSVQK